MSEGSLLSELRKRKVVQTAAIYGAVAWGVTEVIVTVVEQLFLPQWVSTLAVIGFVVGFPVAMFLAWTFDLTSKGLRRTSVASRRGKASIVLSLLLMISGTAGLFFLIKPAIPEREAEMASSLPSAPHNSIAVLPFENSSPDQNDVYLSEGLSDELRDQLNRVSGLRIAARSSSVAVREKSAGAVSMAASLGVASLVEGSLRRQGNKLKISVQLIEGSSGLTLWSETWERGPSELLNVQQAIAEQVVLHILPDSQSAVATPATRDVKANELLLLARHYEQQVHDRQEVDVETLLEAISLYRRATEADPESALAFSRLASALLYLGELDAAEAPIFKALSLNPNLSEVQNTLGEYYWARGMPEAGAAFSRAVELNRNNADALNNVAMVLWLAYQKNVSDIVVELTDLYTRALELDPLSLSRHAALGEFFAKNGYLEGAETEIRKIRELFDNVESYRLIGWLKELIGELDQAIAWTIRARDLEPDNSDHIEKLAALYARIGDFETALELEPEPSVGLLFLMRRYPDLIDLAELLMIEEPGDMDLRYLLAFAYNATGQFDLSLHVLSTTGLPDTVLNGVVRSISDLEGFYTLINALAATDTPETSELARSLAQWGDGRSWWGDIAWGGLYRGCGLAMLGRHEEALRWLADLKESPRMLWYPTIRDTFCLQQYAEEPVYRDILRLYDERKAALRKRLPATLAEFKVAL